MAEWYVKDLSKLTGISVQTLHQYDRIHLLKPSIRLPNGYRIYSEKDLLRLQQIIALKFFGFELSQIKKLLNSDSEAGLAPEMLSWLDKAMDAYWRDRIYRIFNQVGKTSSDLLLHLWTEVLDDMYGDDNARKTEIYEVALADQKISKEAKAWLKTLKH